MRIKETPIMRFARLSQKPVVVFQGGTSSGKTYSILYRLLLLALEERDAVITVVGQDIPNLRKGAMRDWENILRATDAVARYGVKVNLTARSWAFPTGCRVEFTSYKDEQDARSGKREYAFFNEANGISFEIFEAIRVRTSRQIFIDYNPSAPFWVHSEILPRPDRDFCISTYKHNPFVSAKVIADIERYRETDPERWRVYGLGLTGRVDDVVFKRVNWIKAMPPREACTSWLYGLDFGFAKDPSALVAFAVHNGEYYVQKLIYEREMTDNDLAAEFRRLGITDRDEIFADSASPKSIRHLIDHGFAVFRAQKGADSIRYGINLLKDAPLNIVDSPAFRSEQLNYRYLKDGLKPMDDFNHLWDATRYAAMGWQKSNGMRLV